MLSLILEGSRDRRKKGLKIYTWQSRTEICMLGCHMWCLESQPQMLHVIPHPEKCCNYVSYIFCWWYLFRKLLSVLHCWKWWQAHEEMCLFLALSQEMRHDQHDTLSSTGLGKQCATSTSVPMSCSITEFPRPANSSFWKWDAPNRNKECYDSCWKLKRVFNYPNARYTEAYSPCDTWKDFKIIRKDGFLPVYSRKQ